MADPFVQGIAGAVAQHAVDFIRQYIQKSDEPEKAWEEAMRECVIQARKSFRQNYTNSKIPQRDRLKRSVGTIGMSAQELAVRGEINGYDEEMISLIEDFATVCATYESSPNDKAGRYESEFKSQLDELGSEILENTA